MNEYLKTAVISIFVAATISFLFFLFLILGPVESKSDALSITNTFPVSPATATILGSEVNQNFDDIRNWSYLISDINVKAEAGIYCTKLDLKGAGCAGRVEDDAFFGDIWDLLTFDDGVIDNADALHSHTIAGLFGTGSLTASQHGDLSASTATMHSATSVVIADDNSYYDSGNVEGALQEVYAVVNNLGGGLSGTWGFGTLTAWGVMIDLDSAAHTQPANFSGAVDAHAFLLSLAGSNSGTPFFHGDLEYGTCLGMEFDTTATGTLVMTIGRGPASMNTYMYLDNVLAFTIAYDAGGFPGTVTDVPPNSSAAIGGGIFQDLSFVVAATGTHTMEAVKNEDGSGWLYFSVLNNWLNDTKVSSYKPYMRY